MRNNHLMLALAAIALLSCAREQVDVPETITIRAYQEGAAETRTTLIDGGTQVYWEPADELKLFFRGTGSRFLSQNTEVADIAEFSGSLNVVVGVNEGASGSNTLWGLYPYRADATSDGTSVTTTLPTDQTGRADSFAKGTFITLAKSTSFDLAFYNVCGGIRFSLTTEGVKEVVFQGQNDEDIAGKVKLAFVDGVPAVQEVLDGQKSITLTAPGGGTFETGKWYYIVTLPGPLSNGFKMTFNTETQYATLKSSGSKTIRRGIYGSLTEADAGLIYKDKEGGDTPGPDGVIQFADPIAKYACVEKYDTDGDGEVSYAEAATATSLDGLFKNWNTVTSFEEIRFFTSVTSTQNVFTGLPQLKHITIPDNITTLGTFKNCSALETVTLPAALASLPTYCFDGCTSLTSIILPTDITTIPHYAFRNCSSLKTLSIPSSVTSVGESAFSGCADLTSIDLPSVCQSIGYYAFQNCQALEAVDLPASLTTVGSYAFSNCSSLASVTIGGNASLGSYAFSDCTALSLLAFSNGVTLGQYAFSGCISLVNLVLPEDLTTIPSYCFQKCTSLSTITWPASLNTIGDKAFAGCRFEKDGYALQLPASIKTIGNNAFGGIRHLILPSTSPISISAYSFVRGYTYLYVPTNLVEIYKVRTNWSYYSERIRPLSDYPLPFVQPIGGSVGEAVDLGLSVKWASWNVGASEPGEYGSYFSWGEIEPKEYYDITTYQWCNGSTKSYIMYNSNSDYGFVDMKRVLDPIDDAAHVHWGGTWRTPTENEFRELNNNCTKTWTTENGVEGLRLTSKKAGYTDKSIFIPATGERYQDSSVDVGSFGYYMSSERTGYSSSINVLRVYNYSNGFSDTSGGYDRSNGFPVRPVCD